MFTRSHGLLRTLNLEAICAASQRGLLPNLKTFLGSPRHARGQTCQLLLITCYTFSMNKPTRRTKEQQRFIMEIRRSSAASPHKNKSRYTRKDKHKGRAQDHS